MALPLRLAVRTTDAKWLDLHKTVVLDGPLLAWTSRQDVRFRLGGAQVVCGDLS